MSNRPTRHGLGATRRVVARSLCALLAACGSTHSIVTKSGNQGGPTPDGGPVEITLTPATADIFYGGQVQFAANVTGSDQRVSWTVSESGGGNVSTSGVYTAPLVAGTFHIVAQSEADANKSASAAVTVRAPPGTLPTLAPGVWTNISPPGLPFNGEPANGTFGQGLALDPSNPATIYFAAHNFDPTPALAGLFKSTDGGTSWTRIGPLMGPIRVRVDPRNPLHLYDGDGVHGSTLGFWVSNDGGANWEQPSGFTSITQAYVSDVYDVATDPNDFNHVLLTSHSAWGWTDTQWNATAGVMESRDGGRSWTLHPPPLRWGYGHNIKFLGNSSTWLLMTQFGDPGTSGFFRTTDSGATWAQVAAQPMYHGSGQLYRTSSGVLYASCDCSNTAGIIRSTDDGITWTVLEGSPFKTNGLFGDGRLLYSHTGYVGTGATWPFYTAPESDGATWTPYRGGAQSFSDGPFEMAFDAGRRILYSSNWGNGLLALKVP